MLTIATSYIIISLDLATSYCHIHRTLCNYSVVMYLVCLEVFTFLLETIRDHSFNLYLHVLFILYFVWKDQSVLYFS